MKSIFFVVVFVILAITISQPEKADVKFVPLTVSVPHSFMQNDLSKDFSINFIPKSETNSYKVVLNNEINKLVNSSSISFPFSSCKLKQRPNISLSCKLDEVNGNTGQVTALSIKPMITIGQEQVDFYIIKLSKLNANGESVDYQFFTKTRHVLAGRETLNYKVSQN